MPGLRGVGAAWRTAACVAASLGAWGCSSPNDDPEVPVLAALGEIAATPVPNVEALGSVNALVETDSALAVAGTRGFAIFDKGSDTPRATSNEALVSVAAAPSSIPSASFVGVTGDGRFVVFDDNAAMTDFTGRFGLTAGSVRAVANLAAFGIGFLTKEGVAIALGGKVNVSRQADLKDLFVCGARVFARGDQVLFRLDAEAKPAFVTTFPEAITGAACDASGRVVAATARVLYREVGTALAPLAELPGFGAIVSTGEGNALLHVDKLCTLTERGLACAAGWNSITRIFSSRQPMPFALDGGKLVRIAARVDAGAPRDSGVADAAARDAAVPADGATDGAGPTQDAGPKVDGGPKPDAGPSADEVSWTQSVKPIAERACLGCHGSVGAASISLAGYASWVTNRNAIRNRVIVQRNMPPNGASLSAADRTALERWLTP